MKRRGVTGPERGYYGIEISSIFRRPRPTHSPPFPPDVRALAPLYEAFTCAYHNFAAEIVRRFTTTTFVPGQKFIKRVYERGGMRVFGEHEGVRGSWPKPASNSLRIKLIFPAWAGSNETSVTRLMARVWPKTTLEIRKTSLSLSLTLFLSLDIRGSDRSEKGIKKGRLKKRERERETSIFSLSLEPCP